MARRFLTHFDIDNLEVIQTDFLVVGSGIAGLFTALKASDYGMVTVLTKLGTMDTNTERAQGGIAVALDEQDSPRLHREDTLAAGAGLCDEEVVEILVNEGPARVGELIRMGADFNQVEGNIVFAHEGAHSRPRIIHAHDSTGNEIQKTLVQQCQQTLKISVYENTMVIDILVNREGYCIGVLALDQQRNQIVAYLARITVLATGGIGRLYAHTTNPVIATGDGVAAAYRAGCQVMDLGFIQFHPTALYLNGAPRFLISEAVRGEGGLLLNHRGERFMPRYHPQAELAPRDVVARAIWQELQEGAVYLKVTHLGAEWVRSRFPTITSTCLQYGLDITKQPIPVAPAAHYNMGGIKTDSWGRTSIPGLYACGETACNGVHGANRLASNSLLDGMVFGDRIVRGCLEEWKNTYFWTREDIAPINLWADMEEKDEVWAWSAQSGYQELTESEPLLVEDIDINKEFEAEIVIRDLQEIMWNQVGLIRDAKGLAMAVNSLTAMERKIPENLNEAIQIEAANLLLLGKLVATAAWYRKESRGAHFRQDYPQPQASLSNVHFVFQRHYIKS